MPHVWSVSELTATLRQFLEKTFSLVDLEGEVSGFKRYPSGHAYFTLKDANAQISAVMFQHAFDACASRAAIRDGVRLKVRGRVSVGLRSQYQIVVTRARLLGEGELMQRFLELKAKLTAEGLFEAARKRPLPYLPRRIGLVTSEAGAVVHDMCRVLLRRFPDLEVRLFPAVVQGAGAPASIRAGLDYFNGCSDWRADLIIFGRGGGSFEDLFCFNDEALVRAVAASRIPTVSAVGHETDFTLCDFAADVRAGTPSMAAELAVRELRDLRQNLAKSLASLVSSLRAKYEWYSQRLDGLSGDLGDVLWRRETDVRQSLDGLKGRLEVCFAGLVSACSDKAHRLDKLSDAMTSALRLRAVKVEASLEALQGKLAVLSPFSVLDRGYSLTTDENGHVLTDASTLAPGVMIRTRLKHGELTSKVL